MRNGLALAVPAVAAVVVLAAWLTPVRSSPLARTATAVASSQTSAAQGRDSTEPVGDRSGPSSGPPTPVCPGESLAVLGPVRQDGGGMGSVGWDALIHNAGLTRCTVEAPSSVVGRDASGHDVVFFGAGSTYRIVQPGEDAEVKVLTPVVCPPNDAAPPPDHYSDVRLAVNGTYIALPNFDLVTCGTSFVAAELMFPSGP